MKYAVCHPDRKHFSKGFCRNCYLKSHPKQAKKNRIRTNRRWRLIKKENLEKYKRHRDSTSNSYCKTTYGISLAQFKEMLLNQGNVCFLCRGVNSNGARLSIDHDHKTTRIRRLLCIECNHLVGIIERKGIQILNIVKEYLEN